MFAPFQQPKYCCMLTRKESHCPGFLKFPHGSSCNSLFFPMAVHAILSFSVSFSLLLFFLYFLTSPPVWGGGNASTIQSKHEAEIEILTWTAEHRKGQILDNETWLSWFILIIEPQGLFLLLLSICMCIYWPTKKYTTLGIFNKNLLLCLNTC